MALADPQNITIGAAAVLPRVVSNPRSSTFMSADRALSLLVEQTEPRGVARVRYAATRNKVSTSPLTDLKSKVGATVTITVARPNDGSFSEAELIELVTGAFNSLTAGTNANLKKVLAGES